jgi:hypothetical protein
VEKRGLLLDLVAAGDDEGVDGAAAFIALYAARLAMCEQRRQGSGSTL